MTVAPEVYLGSVIVILPAMLRGLRILYLRVTKLYVEDISCMSGVPAAARCFDESDSYISFLQNTFRFENDTDTFGAMFGGVAEEFYGKTGLKNEKILAHYLDPFLYGILYSDRKAGKGQ